MPYKKGLALRTYLFLYHLYLNFAARLLKLCCKYATIRGKSAFAGLYLEAVCIDLPQSCRKIGGEPCD
jgi:hypothetical protein